MPTPEEFVGSLLELPLIRGLRSCAQRLGVRFALRGGILRNFLFAAHRQPDVSLYDYVDPFSDIDLVVESKSDWPQLSQSIAESIPFAGFHHWEAQAERVVHETLPRFGIIPADRLLLWFDGRDKITPQISLQGLNVAVDEVVRYPAIKLDRAPSKSEREIELFDEVLDVLRFARYSSAFPHLPKSVDPADLLRDSEFKNRVRFLPPTRTRQFSTELRRLELAILDLVFTAANWQQAFAMLEICREEIPAGWLEPSRLLTSIFYQSVFNAGNGIGVLLYRPKPQSTLQIRTFNDTRSVPPTLRGTNSVIPWVRLTTSGQHPSDCCNYNDFQSGVATLAWRTKTPEMNFFNLKESEVAAVAAASPSPSEYIEQYSKPDLSFISLPGFVRKGTSLVLRVDHGYVGALLNRNVSFYLGLIPTTLR